MSREDSEPPSSSLTVFLNIDQSVDSLYVPAEAQLTAWIEHAIKGAPGIDDSTHYEVSLSIVDEAAIQTLNRNYRSKDKPTNVLSFPSGMPVLHGEDDGAAQQALGDIIVCQPIIAAEAAAQNKPIEHHWAHMMVHSVLHLVGHDHVQSDEADAMEALEVQLLDALAIPNPYQQSLEVQ